MKMPVAASCAILALPIGARAADVAGAWLIEDAVGGPPARFICVLNAGGTSFGGACAAVVEAAKQATGHLDASSMVFRYHTDYNGSGVHLVYRGDIQPDGSVKGTVKSEGGQGIFQAKALTDTKSGAPVTWKVSAAFSAALQYVALCTFKPDGRNIAGPCTIVDGSSLPVQGTVNGSAVTLAFQPVGRPAPLAYAGMVQGDGTMSGTVSSAGVSGRFTAAKQ